MKPFLCLSSLLLSFQLSTAIDFNDEVFPILEDLCMDCHGLDKQKSGFRMDRRIHFLKGGDSGFPAIVPGDLKKSFIVLSSLSKKIGNKIK